MKLTQNKISWMLLSFLCGVFLFSAPMYSDEQKILNPYDFYQGVQLEVSNYNSPFAWFELPTEAYINSAYSNTLQDVRVFNGTGQEIPSALFFDAEETNEFSYAEFSVQRLISRIEQSQVNPNILGMSAEQHLLVEAIPNKVIQVELPYTQLKEGSTYQSYLLTRNENQLGHFPINTLYLDWINSHDDWQAKVFVYASLDKQNWVNLANNKPIMSLNSNSGIVRENAIELLKGNDNVLSAPYLMVVTVSNQNKVPDLISANASIKIQNTTRRQETLSFITNNEGISLNQLIYRLPSPQPLTEVTIQLQQSNRVLPLKVEYTTDSGEDWLPLANIVVYNQVNDEGLMRNPPLILNGKLIKKLRVTALKGSWDDKPPIIEGKRDAMNIIFNIQGSAPYLLVWGSYYAETENMNYQQFIGQSLNIDELMKYYPKIYTTNNVLELGGEEQLAKNSFVEDDYSWMVILLWGLLSIGIIALFYFGWYLVKEINSKNSN